MIQYLILYLFELVLQSKHFMSISLINKLLRGLRGLRISSIKEAETVEFPSFPIAKRKP